VKEAGNKACWWYCTIQNNKAWLDEQKRIQKLVEKKIFCIFIYTYIRMICDLKNKNKCHHKFYREGHIELNSFVHHQQSLLHNDFRTGSPHRTRNTIRFRILKDKTYLIRSSTNK